MNKDIKEVYLLFLLCDYLDDIDSCMEIPEISIACKNDSNMNELVNKVKNFLENTEVDKNSSIIEKLAYSIFAKQCVCHLYNKLHKKLFLNKNKYKKELYEINKKCGNYFASELSYYRKTTKWKYVPYYLFYIYTRYCIVHKIDKKMDIYKKAF